MEQPRWLLGLLISTALSAQPQYELLLKGGHVIDPGNDVDAVMDVALADEAGAIASHRHCRSGPTANRQCRDNADYEHPEPLAEPHSVSLPCALPRSKASVVRDVAKGLHPQGA
jgi:hypothetical protein